MKRHRVFLGKRFTDLRSKFGARLYPCPAIWLKALHALAGKRFPSSSVLIAKGSLSELETQLLIAADLQYIDRDSLIFPQVEKVSRLLAGLHKRLVS